jgi:hypothetical protein
MRIISWARCFLLGITRRESVVTDVHLRARNCSCAYTVLAVYVFKP